MSIEQHIPLAPLVLSLQTTDATLEQVGGKGASLVRLTGAGLPVPPGFCITTAAYQRFVAANNLQGAILIAATHANPDDPATLENASAHIGTLFAGGTIPDEITTAIRQAYANLGGGELAVAVRSSATAEDLPGMSFAGQQETYLNIRGETRLLEAVKRCWASLWTARALGYRARHNIAPADVSLAVVVQELVPAAAAGILFTANPLTGARNELMLNAAWGLGEAIVSGMVTPDTVLIAKASGTITAQEISDKTVMTVRTPDGTHEEPVPAHRRRAAVLTSVQAAALARIGVQIEQLYGQPMDIEWAMHDSQFFIVQARPITALPEPTTKPQVAPTTEWKLPKPNGSYMRSSVIELLPDPLSPLFATLGLPAWNKVMSTFAQKARITGLRWLELTTINGYAYYDLSFTPAQKARFILLIPRMIPLMYHMLPTARKRWQQEARPAYETVVKRWEAKDLHTLSIAQLLNGARELIAVAAEHYMTLQSGILPAAYMSEGLFTLLYDKLCKRRGDPSALTFLLGYDSLPIQAEKSLYALAQWARAQDGLADALSHMSSEQFTAAYQARNVGVPLAGTPPAAAYQARNVGVPLAGTPPAAAYPHVGVPLAGTPPAAAYPHVGVPLAGTPPAAAYPHVGVPLAGTPWPEFWQRFAAHLARFGHTIYDLDFAKAVVADDPAPLLETLKFFLEDQAPDPNVRQAKATTEREQAMQTTQARLHGLRLQLFRYLLRLAQRFAPLREDALADVGLGWPALRRMLHEIGQRLVEANTIATADDVFWLTADELQAAATAIDTGRPVTDHHTVVTERSILWESERSITPPVALPLKGGTRFMGIDMSAWLPVRTDQSAGDTIKGFAASPGSVTGSARVLHGPNEFNQMRRGDILVAKITTPAWTPLFALAAGVVTDVGGPLSHSSIVAREYHIPAVLGTGVATERIHSEQHVTVDGDTGTVRILGRANSPDAPLR